MVLKEWIKGLYRDNFENVIFKFKEKINGSIIF